MEVFSIDDVARTSDDQAVRRRFDARNRRALIVILWVLFSITLLEGATGPFERNARTADVFIAALIVVVNGVLLLLMRDVSRLEKGALVGIAAPAQSIQRHLTATVVTYLIAQYFLLLAYTRVDEWVGWAIFFPLFVLPFRLLPAELFLVHGSLFAGAAAMVYVSPTQWSVPFVIASAVVNTGAVLLGLLFARRMRVRTTGEWAERRKQALEQIRMRDELRYARELQLSMLPECAPELDWLDLAGVSMPATEVGGDYYDYFADSTRVAVVCADVAGHGMASGLMLATIRSGFTLLYESLEEPAAVLGRLHRLVAKTNRRRMLVTMGVVLVDRQTRRATIASAGHPPVIVRHNGSIRTIELFAPPLGVRLPLEIPEVTLDLAPGDVFVLHSDGVYESRNANDEAYGLERLESLILSHPPHGSAASLRDAIARDVEAFRGGAAQEDDVTIVVGKLMAWGHI